MGKENLTLKERARAVARKVCTQLVNTPEGRLQKAILSTAIVDLTAKNVHIRNSARIYLNSDMPTVQLAGLEPDYIRRVLRQAGLLEAAA